MTGTTLNALYYPYSRCTNPNTLKRAILLFDEIWFIDPTSHRMREGLISDDRDVPVDIMSEWTSIRDEYNTLFERNIVRLYDPEVLIKKNDQLLSLSLKSDIEDTNVWNLFAATGMSTWNMLRCRIPPSALEFLISQTPGRITYGARTAAGEAGYGGRDSYYFFTDGKVKFEHDNYGKRNSKIRAMEKEFMCLFINTHGSSLAVNQAILVAEELNLVPLTDSAAHHELLHRKHQRLVELPRSQVRIQISEFNLPPQESIRRISMTVFDNLLSENILDRITIEDAVRFRDESKEASVHFREYMLDFTSQIGSMPLDEKYEAELGKIVSGKVLPEARKTEDTYRDIWSSMFGKISKEAFSAGSPALIATAFTGFSLTELLTGVAAGLDAIAPDAVTETRKARRNSMSYYIRTKADKL